MERYYKRGFLNEKEGTAFYEAVIDNEFANYIDASFSVSDCNRKVTLDFNVYDFKDVSNVRYKIDSLIEALTEFRDKLEESIICS